MRTIIGLAALARSGKDTVASMLLSYPGVAAFALADPLKAGCQVLFGLTDAETWHDDRKEQTIALWGRSPREFFQTVGTEWMRHHNPDHWLMRADREINPPIHEDVAPLSPDLADADAPFALAAQAFFDFTDAQVRGDARLLSDPYWGLTPQAAIDLLKRHALAMFPDYAQRRAERPALSLTQKSQVPPDARVIIIKDIRFENEAAFLRAHHGTIWHLIRPNLPKVNAHSSELGVERDAEDIVILNSGSLADLKHHVEQAWQAHRRSN